MRSGLKLSMGIALLMGVTGVLFDTVELKAQSAYGNGYAANNQPERKPSLLRRLFSKRNSKSRPTAQQAPYGQPQYPTGQPQQYQAPPHTNGAVGGKSKIQQMLEAKYRAEGREIPPLTLSELSESQGIEQPQPQQSMQPQQQQFSQQLPYQQESSATQQNAAAAYQQYNQIPQQQSAATPSYRSPAHQNYPSASQQAIVDAAGRKQPRKPSGFRRFLSRINPFRKRDEEQEQAMPAPSLPAQQYQGAPGGYQNPPVYAKQQPAYQAPPQQYRAPQFRNPAGLTANTVTTPPAVQNQFNQRPEPSFEQFPQNTVSSNPRPFPGVPDVAEQETPDEPNIFKATEPNFEEELPTLADNAVLELKEKVEEELTPFDEEPLPSLADVEKLVEAAQIAKDGFRPTKLPEFKEPIIRHGSNDETVAPQVAETTEDPKAAEPTEEIQFDTQTEELQLDAETEAPQLAADETTSPYSGKTLDGEEADLPKLQQVPQRNNYINMENLNAKVDTESLRREKRRLLLLSRPERKGFKGFCPVTLKNDRDLVDAKPEFQAVYEEKVYQLSSADAKAEFERAPHDYAPAKGGIDVVKYSLEENEEEGTLEFAAWFRGRLYLFSSAVTYDAFMSSPSKFATPLEQPQEKAAQTE